MAVTLTLYTKMPANIFGGETAGESSAVDFLSDTIKVALATSSYTPNQDSHEFFSDITNEITGTGYTAGGATLASPTVTVTGASNKTTFDAADVSWASATFTCRYAIIYKSTGTASTSPLIAYIDFGTNQSPSSQDFQIVWNSSGIFTATVP